LSSIFISLGCNQLKIEQEPGLMPQKIELAVKDFELGQFIGAVSGSDESFQEIVESGDNSVA